MLIKKISSHGNKKSALLCFSLYVIFLFIGIIGCVLADIFLIKKNFHITFGFLFTIPFTLLIFFGTLFSYDWFLNFYGNKKEINKPKVLIVLFFLCKSLLYIIPILTASLLYFFYKNQSLFNIFSVFIGMILLWIANLVTQLIMLKIDFNKMVKERSKLQNVPTGDSLANN